MPQTHFDSPMEDRTSLDIQKRLAQFWTQTAPEISKSNTAPIDLKDLENPQMVAEYAAKISSQLL